MAIQRKDIGLSWTQESKYRAGQGEYMNNDGEMWSRNYEIINIV